MSWAPSWMLFCLQGRVQLGDSGLGGGAEKKNGHGITLGCRWYRSCRGLYQWRKTRASGGRFPHFPLDRLPGTVCRVMSKHHAVHALTSLTSGRDRAQQVVGQPGPVGSHAVSLDTQRSTMDRHKVRLSPITPTLAHGSSTAKRLPESRDITPPPAFLRTISVSGPQEVEFSQRFTSRGCGSARPGPGKAMRRTISSGQARRGPTLAPHL